MLRVELTTQDVNKLQKAYEHLDRLIELIEETNRKRDLPHKPSRFIVEAHACLREVLYDE